MMQSMLIALVGAASSALASALVTGLRTRGDHQPGSDFTLLQYTGKFCSGRFVALELKLDMMTQVLLPEGRSPEVLCNKLVQNETTGAFVVHSCPGSGTGCPTNCDGCQEDLVKHFTLNVCNSGWKLLPGLAPEDCSGEHKVCASKNRVDVGLARWCNKWPAPGTSAYTIKTSEDMQKEQAAN